MDGSTCIITDIPDVLLIEIISYLNASERVQLARCGEKFHNLVFNERKLLKNLDFSNKAGVTSASDVYEYFKSENTSKHIRKVNLRNVNFNGYHKDLLGWVSTAVNLVDIDIHGIWIKEKWVLEFFLRPLPNVRRLSFDWPSSRTSVGIDPSVSLRERFEKLTYMSLILWEVHLFNVLYDALKFCRDLKKLRIIVAARRLWLSSPVLFIKLKNLDSVEYYGPRPNQVAEFFVSSLLYRKKWTHFQISNPQYDQDGFYLERNVEVCEELLESKSLRTLSYNYPEFAFQLDGMVVSICLLEKVMQLSQGHLPEKFCCFTLNNSAIKVQPAIPYVSWSSSLWMLNIEETKRLLKDPAYKISYLRIAHNIEQECDAHKVTSAFPSLTEVVIANIIQNETKTLEKRPQPDERLETRDSAALSEPDESLNPESSFSKLVGGTPYLRNLTIIADTSFYQFKDVSEPKMTWDLAALTLIPRWKNLTTIRLRRIPIMDGEFLVEIGKQCNHLETMELCELGPVNTPCYTNELLQMLTYCSNLKDFILRQRGIERLSEIFLLLGKNPGLRKVCVENIHDKKTDTDFGPSIKHLLCHCLKLTTFKCLMKMCETASEKLKSTLERLKGELKRPTFQFQVGYGCTENLDQDPLYLPVYNFCGHSSA